jgi:hypothetical protein
MQNQNTRECLEVKAYITAGDEAVATFIYRKTEGSPSSITIDGDSPKIIQRLVSILKDLGHEP